MTIDEIEIERLYHSGGALLVAYDQAEVYAFELAIQNFMRSEGITGTFVSERGSTLDALLREVQKISQRGVHARPSILLLRNIGVYEYKTLITLRLDMRASEYRGVTVFGILDMSGAWDDPDDDKVYAERYGSALKLPAYKLCGEQLCSMALRKKSSSALDLINRHRRSIGQKPLDPVAERWTEEDLEIEAKRIRRLNGRRPNVTKLVARLKAMP